jgi:hypothetical protein
MLRAVGSGTRCRPRWGFVAEPRVGAILSGSALWWRLISLDRRGTTRCGARSRTAGCPATAGRFGPRGRDRRGRGGITHFGSIEAARCCVVAGLALAVLPHVAVAAQFADQSLRRVAGLPLPDVPGGQPSEMGLDSRDHDHGGGDRSSRHMVSHPSSQGLSGITRHNATPPVLACTVWWPDNRLV